VFTPILEEGFDKAIIEWKNPFVKMDIDCQDIVMDLEYSPVKKEAGNLVLSIDQN